MHGLKGEISRFHTSHDSSLRGRENNRPWEKPHELNKYFYPEYRHPVKTTNLYPENSHTLQYMVNSAVQQHQHHSFNNDSRSMYGHPIVYNHYMFCCDGTKNQRAHEIIYGNTEKQSANYSASTKHAYPQNDTRYYYKHKSQTSSFSNSPKIRVRDVHTLNNYFNDYYLSNNLQRGNNHSSFLGTNHTIRSKDFTQQQSQIPRVEESVEKNFQNHQIFKTVKPLNIYQTNVLSYESCREDNQKRNNHPQLLTNLSDANSARSNYHSVRKVNDIASNNFNCPTNYGFQCNSNMLSSVTSCENNNLINNSCEKNSNRLVSQQFKDNASVDQEPNHCTQGLCQGLTIVEEGNFETSYSNNSIITTGTSHVERDDAQNLQRKNLKQVNSAFSVPTSVIVRVENNINDSEAPRVQSTNNCKNLNKETPHSCSLLYSAIENLYPNTTFEFDNSRLHNKSDTCNELTLNEQSKHFIPESTIKQENTKVKNEATEKLPKKTCSDNSSSKSEIGNSEGEKNSKLNDSVQKSKSSGLKGAVQKCNKKLIDLKECEKISENDDQATVTVVVEIPKEKFDSNKSKRFLISTSHSLEKPDIENLYSEKSENSTSNQDLIKPAEEKDIKRGNLENGVVTNSSEEFQAKIDRKKLDKLKQFLENSSSFEEPWCEDLKKEKTSETRSRNKRKHEDEFLCQRRRKLNKSCVVKNKNIKREMISLKNFKTQVNENKDNINGFEKSPTPKAKEPVEEKTRGAEKSLKVPKSNLNLDIEICSREVASTEKNDKLKSLNKETKEEKGSVFKISNYTPSSNIKSCKVKRKDSAKENFQKEKKQSKLKSSNSESSCSMMDDYKVIVEVIRAFKKIKKSYCTYCGSLRSADRFWLNLVTAELKCLYCFKKTSTPSNLKRNKM